MLKSAGTIPGIILGILAITGLGVSPSEAQIRTSIPCVAIAKDWTRCSGGWLYKCKQSAERQSGGKCARQNFCLPAGRPC